MLNCMIKDSIVIYGHPWEAADVSGLILGLHTANERRPYKVTQSLIGWVQT